MGSASKSSSGSNSTDMTPEAFRGLQGPLADALGTFFSGEQGGYQGDITSEVAPNEQAIIDRLMRVTSGPGSNTGQQTLNDIARNPNTQTPGYGNASAGTMADRAFNAQQAPGYREGPSTAVGYQAPQGVSQYGDNFQQAYGDTGAYRKADGNPFLRASIDAASRPILENLTQTTQRDLPGRFAEAGQFTSPRGSSAFDRAAAVATSGAASAIGDVSARLSGASYEAERGREFEAQQADRSRLAQEVSNELARRGEYGEAARTRLQSAQETAASRGFLSGEATRAWDRGNITGAQERNAASGEAERTREFEATQAGEDRRLQAAAQLPQVQTSEVNNLIQQLQAAALPRLISEGNMDRGVATFQSQIDNLLQAMGIGAAVTRPVLGQSSQSKSKGGSVAGPSGG